MDYSKLSDFEINSAVHNALMSEPYDIVFLGGDKIRWVRGDTDVTTGKVEYKKNSLKDYCNNVSDAWPIITENNISIILDNATMPCATSNARDLFNNEDPVVTVVYEKPLRAAMIVFLMMHDDK